MTRRATDRAPDGGMALIVVVWVVGLLSLFVMAFAFDMHVEARIASSWRKRFKAEYLSRAGFELARMILFETRDRDVANPDPSVYLAKGSDEQARQSAMAVARGGSTELTRELGEGTLQLSIRPENARINLNSLIHPADRERTLTAWQPLFEAIGLPWETHDALVDCLIDWVDQDELTHLNGAESDYYQTLEPPYQAKNGPLDTVDELALIKGFEEPVPETDRPIYQALAPFLTAYATDAKLNVNAADLSTLMGYLDIDAALADQIVRARYGPDGEPGTDDDLWFRNVAELVAQVPALPQDKAGKLAFTATGRFTLISRGQAGDLVYTASSIVDFNGQQILVLRWSEGEPTDGEMGEWSGGAVTSAAPDGSRESGSDDAGGSDG